MPTSKVIQTPIAREIAGASKKKGGIVPMPFKLAPSDLSFAERAEFSFDNKVLIDAEPEDVLEVLESVENGRDWLPHFLRARWMSGDERGPGAVLVESFRFMKIRLRIVTREPGRRWVASVEACSIPLASQMLEDVECTPTDDGKTEFRWRVYYDVLPEARPLHPVVRPFFKRFFRDATRGLAAYMATRPSEDDYLTGG